MPHDNGLKLSLHPYVPKCEVYISGYVSLIILFTLLIDNIIYTWL